MAYQHDILNDIRQMAANEGLFTKAEIVEMLVEAADAIVQDRHALRKLRAGIMEALGHLEASSHLQVNRQKSLLPKRKRLPLG
jgi:transcription elongation factor